MNVPGLDAADALLIVDMQVDFLPGGSLGVPLGDEVLGPINRLVARANGFAELIVPEAMRAVEVHPGDGERALAAMTGRGAQPVSVDALAAAGA